MPGVVKTAEPAFVRKTRARTERKSSSSRKVGSLAELEKLFSSTLDEHTEVRLARQRLENLGSSEAEADYDPTESDESREKRKQIDAARQVSRDTVQRYLEDINNGALSGNMDLLVEAATGLLNLGPHLPYKARSRLLPLINAVHSMKAGANLPKFDASAARQRIDDAITALNQYLADGDARELESLRVGESTVELPLYINRPTLISGVRILVSAPAGGALPKKHARALAANVYEVTSRLIGVPATGGEDKAFERARRYCVRKLKREPSQVALHRPDSDAYWFPLLPFQARIEVAIFPEQARLSDPSFDSPQVRQQRIQQQRERREQFELEHHALYRHLDLMLDGFTSNREKAAQIRSTFIARFGLRPNVRWIRVRARIESARVDAIYYAADAAARLRINMQARADLADAEHLQSEYMRHLATARMCRKRAKEVQLEIDELKAKLTHPHKEQARNLARVARELAARA